MKAICLVIVLLSVIQFAIIYRLTEATQHHMDLLRDRIQDFANSSDLPLNKEKHFIWIVAHSNWYAALFKEGSGLALWISGLFGGGAAIFCLAQVIKPTKPKTDTVDREMKISPPETPAPR